MALSLGWMFICHEQNEIVRIQDKPGLSVKLMEYGSDKVMILTTTIMFMIVNLLFGPKLFGIVLIQMTQKLNLDYKSSF